MKDLAKGVAAMIAVLVVVNEIPSPFGPGVTSDRFFWTTAPFIAWGAAQYFVAALVGAYVANQRFVLPALLVSLALIVFAVYTLKLISVVADPYLSYAELTARNGLGFTAGLLATIVGAELGAWLRRRNEDSQLLAA